MKWIKNHLKVIISVILIALLGIYVCSFGLKKALDNEIFTKPTVETKIYTVWHIETFEGGGKSRIIYLKNIAKEIEKKHPGILFNIKQIEPEKVENELTLSMPDIVSFGFGLGKTLLPYLDVQENTYSVRDSLINSGSFSNKLYAIPYIVSGYAFVSHNSENTTSIYGENAYTDASVFNNSATKFPSQYEAYKHFVNNKKINLIGTARDVFRVDNLNKIGRTNATITPLGGHTDLIQYAGATIIDEMTNLFISNLLSVENQAKLIEYSLFSSLHTKLYSSGIYSDMENSLFESKVKNVFYD